MADDIAKNHQTIWLQPRCCVAERAWCQTDPGPCEGCGMPSVKYIRAELVNSQAVTQQHCGWMRVYLDTMNERNWKDLRDRLSDQLEKLSDHLGVNEKLDAAVQQGPEKP